MIVYESTNLIWSKILGSVNVFHRFGCHWTPCTGLNLELIFLRLQRWANGWSILSHIIASFCLLIVPVWCHFLDNIFNVLSKITDAIRISYRQLTKCNIALLLTVDVVPHFGDVFSRKWDSQAFDCCGEVFLADLVFAALIQEEENFRLVAVLVLHASQHQADQVLDVIELRLRLYDRNFLCRLRWLRCIFLVDSIGDHDRIQALRIVLITVNLLWVTLDKLFQYVEPTRVSHFVLNTFNFGFN